MTILRVTEVHNLGPDENKSNERINYAVDSITKFTTEAKKWFTSETLERVFIDVLEVK